MNASACASTDNRIQWSQILWTRCEEVVRKLQVRIIKAQQRPVELAASWS
jgi:RNA-directed DNA polymerase